MRDVARRVDVSVSTVSLALRNSPLVAAETQAAVRAAVAALGYRVNPYVAAHMRSRRKPHAGIAAPLIALVDTQRRRHGWRDNRTTTVRAMLAGAKAQAAARGYETREFWLHEPGVSHARFSAMLRARGIHGILLGPSSDLHIDLELTWEWFSVVRLGSARMTPMLHRVVIDHYEAGMRAAHRVHELGWRRPLFPVRELFSAAHDRRMESGFRTAWAHLPEAEPMPETETAELVDGATLKRWIKQHRPDVIIDSEERYLGSLLKVAGWHVPEEIGLMSMCVANAGDPVSGCLQNGEAMGTAGVDLLIAMIERNETGVPAAPFTLSLATTWNVGTTLVAASGATAARPRKT